ncbi:high frequency lysogenization protein HflD [Thioalkalivibrio paradoxus]|uniref:High frequency lysogenization protein HflD homolog n=1 Tax=Thioalkalivibrio paradoxus ARh 1 TaxID=713585 RepID=W0DI91_9GAMM|nr:high frequency lysogenization protein HflD [Thioalkalivibrio paradoxus]AHE98339.1 lysogenization protein HflD [Thioalkalivibrio paradoxus ARh 1]
MERSDYNRTLALAAIFQTAALVKDLAWRGHCDEHEFEVLVGSLFAFDAETPAAVYRGEANLRNGLERIEVQLKSGGKPPDMEITRYAIGLIFLERKLQARPEMLQALGDGLKGAERQVEYFNLSHESVIARLAEVYQETISPLGPRIIVQGEQTHLSNPGTAARIRALLLAGIRAAVLWRQAGGSRWKLLFGRNRLISEARDLLHRLNS